MSEEGHFSPLVEGVKHLSNPLILHFSSKNSLKSTVFASLCSCFWWVRIIYITQTDCASCSVSFSGLKIHNSSICTVEITQYALKGQKLIALG